MRFRFCGELDAPDWLLAEISTLSKLARPSPLCFSVAYTRASG
jgi:hypothetical protein